jgi:hypothetical protein
MTEHVPVDVKDHVIEDHKSLPAEQFPLKFAYCDFCSLFIVALRENEFLLTIERESSEFELMNYLKETPKGEEGSDVYGPKCEAARPLVVFDDSKDDGDLRKSDKYVADVFVKDSSYSVQVRASRAPS